MDENTLNEMYVYITSSIELLNNVNLNNGIKSIKDRNPDFNKTRYLPILNFIKDYKELDTQEYAESGNPKDKINNL